MNERLTMNCGCLPWLVLITGVGSGAILLFVFGDQVIYIGSSSILGSWLAIPGGLCASVLLIALAPWIFRMKI